MQHLFTSILLLLTVCAAVLELDAAVYWPGKTTSGSGASGSRNHDRRAVGSARNFSISELPGLSRKPLTSEDVVVNGQKMTLEIYQLNAAWDILQRTLRSRVAPEQLMYGQDFLRMVVPMGNNRTERWLFVCADPRRPVTAFRIESNRVLPPPTRWHSELPPLPSGGVPEMNMEIPRVDAVYGAFSNCNGDPTQLLVSYSARLAASGWIGAGAEHSPSIRGSGEIYFRNQPERQVLWIKFSENGCGAFYMKKLK